MTSVTQNLLNIRQRIQQACDSCGRDPAEVNLLAVSKKHPADAIRVAFAAGQKAFGENFVQEALGKQRQLQNLAIESDVCGLINPYDLCVKYGFISPQTSDSNETQYNQPSLSKT